MIFHAFRSQDAFPYHQLPRLAAGALLSGMLLSSAVPLAQQNDPDAPAQNASQLNSEANAAKEQGKLTKGQKKAVKAEKKAAKKESKVEDDQKKAAAANSNLNNPQ